MATVSPRTRAANARPLLWAGPQREIACHRCRVRKKKCDKKRPTCGECAKCGSDCVPLRPKHTASSRNVPLNYVQLLENHIASLETRLRDASPGIAVDHLSPVNKHSSHEFGDPSGPEVEKDDSGRTGADAELFYDLGPDENWLDQGGSNDEQNSVSEPWRLDAASNKHPSPIELPDTELIREGVDSSQDLQSPSCIFTAPLGEFMAGWNLQVNSIDFRSSTLSSHRLSIDVATRYATEYFIGAHPMWPFLHQTQWNDCWNSWSDNLRTNDPKYGWMTFFVEMVLSVGALLVQNSNPEPEHVEFSRGLHLKALNKYNSPVIQDRSSLLRTQAALLLTIHAMHLDSVQTLMDRASEAMVNCAYARRDQLTSAAASRPKSEIELELNKQTVRSCYIIGILLSYSTDRASAFDSQLLDDEIAECDSITSSSGESPPGDIGSSSDMAVSRGMLLEEHVFDLRRIQHKIMRTLRKLEREAALENHMVPNLWRSQIRYTLENWVLGISAYSTSPDARERFKSHDWLLKLANYTILSLFPNPDLAVRSGDASHLVTAACQVLSTFHRLRVKDHTSCYTWTAFLHQFQAGILLVYCIWATPTHQQLLFYNRRAVCQAMFACSATLVEFAHKWTNAQVFRDVFDLLTQEIPISEYGDPTQEWTIPPNRGEELKRMTGMLEDLKVQTKITSLLQKMARGPRPSYVSPSIDETKWMQYVCR